ncbi:GntR family transcriptional regulator [Streptomyces griseofuscus]|uniref:GntR family transcriptional regulator n=1 Tax=Streptomyces griseofuscus TaxID=146922 RepID=UPI0037FE5697
MQRGDDARQPEGGRCLSSSATLGRLEGGLTCGSGRAWDPWHQRGRHVRGAEVSEASPRGTYLQVADALKRRIKSGVITDKVPTEAAIAAEFGIARTTVRRALGLLESEGVIESTAGLGRRVAGGEAHQAPYERVRDDLLARIGDGRLEAGETVPSESALATEYGVSRGTVRRALAALEAAGLVQSRQGVGRVVRASTDQG